MSDQKNKDSSVKQIVRLTASAVDKVKSMMVRDDKQGSCLRIGVVTGGCAGLSYEMRFQNKPYDNDIKFEQDGITILINPESISFLNGIEIDYIDTLKESGFQYKNPNASSSCGCGDRKSTRLNSSHT